MNILRLARYVTVTVVAAAGLWLPAAPVSATPPHVVFIMMENTGKWGIIGTDANRARSPYQAGLWTNPAVWHFTNYFGITHPSLPNYLGFASGSTQGTTGSDSVYAGKFTGPSLWSQLSAAGITWGVYQDSMPAVCSKTGKYNDLPGNDQYVLRHNPAMPFSVIASSAALCGNVQPLTVLNLGALPAVSFITPGICNDDHGLPSTDPDYGKFTNCAKGSTALYARGDTWLAHLVPQITAAGATVIITDDEGGNNLGVNGTVGGGSLWAVELGAGVTGGNVTAQFNHYSVLAAVERAYGLPRLGAAATANLVPLP